ncbi:ribonuclease HII [Gloeomargarita lithophora Alchichica-D10]|uniref:Ribonuclease HII n=1 Tax=Gloeomargarita lithophora Alchichica-D10 TaxID=1188229 RepID=A0A1J0AA54_9CYAN|nr:ribonuclease HII [Gloeomargarita lithophora]APB32824.1 ribonuclease HII [Gloeomargarita lithophora Alchichica-D10]
MVTHLQLGVDEVGRGALCGPVVSAAVVLDGAGMAKLRQGGLRESKQLSPKQRQAWVPRIQALALAWHIAWAEPQEIDTYNILQATLLSMRRAVMAIPLTPDICLVDGCHAIPDLPYPQRAVIQGDATEISIAAASILAKVWRDEYLCQLAPAYPVYNLACNKGYGTLNHRLALQRYGPSSIHRLSFRPCQLSQTKLP